MAMAAKVEWTPEIMELIEIVELIESVRSQKVVWDSSCNGYKSKNALGSAWVQIAIDCGLEGKASHVKAKWRDLKDTYRKKLKMLTPKSGNARGAESLLAMDGQNEFFEKFLCCGNSNNLRLLDRR